jgi:crotonobetainyl-CoA:carnitine CoA-transferase CaiB-like acyl-CoA transferase
MEWPLSGLRVADLSAGIAGGYCTKVLADGGAEVIKLEPPEGDRLRGWSARTADDMLPPGEGGALFQFLACSKSSVVIDPDDSGDRELARRVVAGADVVVWSEGSRLAEMPEFAPARLRELAPGAVVVAITPWGLAGPWRGRPWTDATLQALSGALMTRGDPDRPPVIQGGAICEWATGAMAAVGLLAARWKAVRTGAGDLVDVSMLEAALLTLTMYTATWASIAGSPMRANRQVNLPAIHQTKDGYVGFMVVTGQQWLDFCVLVEQPEWLEDESLGRFDVRSRRRRELVPAIDAWAAQRTTAEVLEVADALRVPASEVTNGATVTSYEHFVKRNAFVSNPRSGFTQPDVPYTLSGGAERRPAGPPPLLGEHTAAVRARDLPRAAAGGTQRDTPEALPFAGLRVADFTMNWAGPIVSHVLAMYGADVIHVESIQRPDGIRFQSVRPMTEDHWWEWAPLYQGPNTNKRDLTLNLSSPRGRELALRLVAECDVVVENYSPRVMEAWGLDYDELVTVNPDLIMVRAPAFGLSGPLRDRGGYTQTMEMASGLSWLTGYPDTAPQIPNGPMDPLAGTHGTIALLLALEYRRRTGKGMRIESPMVFGALNVAAEQVIEYSAYGNLLNRDGDRSPRAVPQGVYRTADPLPDGQQDRWVLISVATDQQWEALRQVLGDPSWARDPSYATAAGRRPAHDEIDGYLAAWCATRDSAVIAESLCAAGVPAATVLCQGEQAAISQLTARRFWEDVSHPVLGHYTAQAYPARLVAGPAVHNRTHSPLLGEHNEDILSALLGLTAEEIAQLGRDGIIGTRPASTDSSRGFT